ncbi:hypothetical protein HDU98_005739 [Podochytrium sp. JEL0797]|nr:hypothetical protein HDU98_005739 [Podochytrium sp. JEL0797]
MISPLHTMWIGVLSFQLVSAIASTTFNAASKPVCIDTSLAYCASFAPSIAGDVTAILIQSSASGWAGIGFGGTSMSAVSNFVIGFNGSTTLRGPVSSEGEPPLATNQASLTPISFIEAMSIFPSALDPSSQAAVLSFAFTVPSTYLTSSGLTHFIYAIGSTPPSSPTAVPYHDGPHGSFAFDVNAGISGGVSASTIPTSYIAHGAVMFTAWGVIPYLIVFVARYLKFKLGHWWFILHVGGAVLGTLGGTLAAMLIITVGRGQAVKTSGSTHVVLGSIVIYGVLPLQFILGIVADRMFVPNRKYVPWWDVLHWWLGRFALIATAANIYLGLGVAGVRGGWYVGYWVWFGLTAAMLFAGHWVFGMSVHVGGSGPEKINEPVMEEGAAGEQEEAYIPAVGEIIHAK